MLTVNNLSFRFGKRPLFEDVNLKFTPGNCYGIIGANGAGKSTFLKLLSGEYDTQTGTIEKDSGARMSVLSQNQNAYDDRQVLETVIMGNEKLHEIMQEKEAIYSKEDFSEEDGIRASELEAEFAEMNGWEAESEAAAMLSGLGIEESKHYLHMVDLPANEKVRVLLAQALFGSPDILILDEPTNNLDYESIRWLEDFLKDFENTVIVVSHDRHFLDQVCTHICDIDYGKIQLFVGNYSFWYESSQLALRQRQEQNKKVEEKRKELQEFIQRFSANASKSKQATARGKMLEKLTLEDIQPSSRRYPYISFKPERDIGDQVLHTENLSYPGPEGYPLFKDVELNIRPKDKVAVFSKDPMAVSRFFEVINGKAEPQTGSYKWGITTRVGYFPHENGNYFDTDLQLVDWLRQYSKEKEEQFVRGFLGRMLFSQEEALKKANVLSGGEKVRCMLSKLMLEQPNVLVMDDPTNHLDLEAITALNNGLKDFPGVLLFTSHDFEFMSSLSNRVVELTPSGIIDKMMSFEEYMEDEHIKDQRQKMYPALVTE